MKNTMNGLKVDMIHEEIILSKAFAKKAMNTNNPEYRAFVEARTTFPTYTIVYGKIKGNPNKQTYKGLTYAYMEKYIQLHDKSGEIMEDYKEIRLIAECCKSEYPMVKEWFLATFPNIAERGIVEIDEPEDADPQHAERKIA